MAAETPEQRNGDLKEIHALLQSLFREVEGTNRRLDKVNGRLDRHEDAIAAAVNAATEMRVKVSTLNHEVFDRGERPDRQDVATAALIKDLQTLVQAATGGDNRPAFTVGDVNLVTKVGKLAWALIGLLGGAGALYWAQQVIK